MKYVIYIKRSRSGATNRAYVMMKENESHCEADLNDYMAKNRNMWGARDSLHMVDADSLKEAKRKAFIEKFGSFKYRNCIGV